MKPTASADREVDWAGLRADRAAEIIVTKPDGKRRRGSGYLVSVGTVLTATHVVAEATGIQVRFDADRPGERTVDATVEWAHPGIDVAVLTVPDQASGNSVAPAAFARLGERDVEVRCSAVGFPCFKLRDDADGKPYRDSEHVHATCMVHSNQREGTLDLTVTPPATRPNPQASPWEGMSGAAVFSRGKVVGVVSRHHLSDGLGRLAATRVDRWAETLTPDELGLLEAVLGCSLDPEVLPDVAPPSSPAWTMLDRYAGMLRDNTRARLTDTHRHVELDRTSARRALAQRLDETATGPGVLVVVGEPDVGKSALALRVIQDLEEAGASVASVSLRDLPPTVAEFESDLGAHLTEVLQEVEATAARLLVVDGAEAVLEGRGQLLTDLAAAALRAGFGVAAVTRTDAAQAVSDALEKAADITTPADSRTPPAEHEVPHLSQAEKEELTQAFPSVARFGQQPRSAWLLGRPGLVDLLLRADATHVLPDGALSEADVFDAVWSRLVRRGEMTPVGGPSPDAREQAMVALARRRLLPDVADLAAPDSAALPSLRSDGLLMPAGPRRTWRPVDDFASDLVRDLALAHLLLSDGWGLLETAGAPRWTLRAVRLACQAQLAAAHPDSESARRRLQQDFDSLAVDHGARWAELPSEALLTLGSAAEALAAARLTITGGDQSPRHLAMLLRLARDGHSQGGVGDPVILAPVVELTHSLGLYPAKGDEIFKSSGIAALVRELVLAWLRGLAAAGTPSLPLRRQVRDVVLDAEPPGHDQFAVEAIAMLDADLDARAEGFLRALAEDGTHLAPAVESGHVARSLSRVRPELLLSLTEAYYIKRPRPGGPWSPQPDPLDDGVRRHTVAGLLGPRASRVFGPFRWLLAAKPIETLAMIHRLLDHASATRVHLRGFYSSDRVQSAGEPEGLELDLPGSGRRLCVGDAHVWSWYRATGIGPDACVSALLAVEQFADQLIDSHDLPVGRVTELLLRDCGNLAMPGLVVGLLVRHIERIGTELDRWIARPEIWRLETLRVAAETTSIHVQGPDPADVMGRERRHQTFLEVAEELTATAVLRGNQERLAVLHDLGDELMRRAGENARGDQVGTESTVMAKGWASRLQARNYRLVAVDGGVVVEYQSPPDVVAGLAADNAELARGRQVFRLVATYAVNEDRIAPIDSLAADVALARALAADPPQLGLSYARDSVVATAAAALRAHADGRIDLVEDDIDWAAGLLLDAALCPHEEEHAGMSSLYPVGADRSAAIGVPLLLLPAFATVRIDHDVVERALDRCATSLFDEVRYALPLGLTRVWSAPCSNVPEAGRRRPVPARILSILRRTGPRSGRCRHEIAWTAVESGLREHWGPWDEELQCRTVARLSGPPAEALRTVETDRLMVNRLTGPLMSAADAARSRCCIASRAERLLGTLWDAHRRGVAHWATKNYNTPTLQESHRRVARVLLQEADRGNGTPLADHVRAFAGNAPALAQLLRDLSVLCTYDTDLRRTLPRIWPSVMRTALDAIDAGADPLKGALRGRSAIAGLIPHPQLDSASENPSAALQAAAREWIDPETLGPLIARWMPIARGTPEAVDALIGLIETTSEPWQAATGLQWIDELIGDNHAAVASRSWRLVPWLEGLSASSHVRPPSRVRLQHLVDGLATHGDSRAAALQRLDG
ncbi:serine protease [Embleya hyalina]|uniref:Uncharacterized protein n=1 Tax=Embleya hyalina TaxID=516124 RepID=A0A401YXC0_9ACTN|nr:serine protease [Embleya hyalina]GCD99267.1 hypothetical protein EHYA_06981 [Embleya hyalina]